MIKNKIDWDYRFNVIYDKESRDAKAANEIFEKLRNENPIGE